MFPERSAEPSEAALAEALGPAIECWHEVERRVAELGPCTPGWSFGGPKHGWSRRLQGRKRAILYLTPCAGWFRAGIALPDAARDAALAADLPAPAIALVREATRYPEGWAVRMDVRTADDVDTIVRLARLKTEAGS